MDKNHIEKFLTITTIPHTDSGKKANNTDRLWDCLWRAHRDVLTGYAYLPDYCTTKNSENKINQVVQCLYDIIKNSTDALTSESLINKLCNNFNNVEFGAIQKLVNMTLKYIIILNTYDNDFNISVNESKCDCPIDSSILKKLSITDIKWTKITPTEYNNIQNKIRDSLQEEHKNCGNIIYDFINWNPSN